MLTFFPIFTLAISPRIVELYQILDPLSISTSPIISALGAIKQSFAIFGEWFLNE
jgi:hypothetical protein